jgi:hypothetical protein
MQTPSLKVRYHQERPKRPVYITDIEDLNYVVSVARMVCLQPDAFKIAHLRQAIEDAERGPEG